MQDVNDLILDPIERGVGMLPLGEYPAGRALWGGAIGGGLVFLFKPEIMFDKKTGHARPWVLTNPKAKNATIFPWPAAVLIPAVVLGVFI